MSISITDKFLLDIYNFLSTAKNATEFILRPYPTMGNSLPGPKNPILAKYKKEKSKREFNNLVYYLRRKGYIKIKTSKDNKAIILTKEGIDKALRASFEIEGAKKRKDGKWIMLIFDVPQKYKKSRDLLRSILTNLGYKMFQQSVWISPYDVSDKTEMLLQMHSLDKYVKIFLIEEL